MDTFKNIGRMPAGRNRDVNTLLPQLLQQRHNVRFQIKVGNIFGD